MTKELVDRPYNKIAATQKEKAIVRENLIGEYEAINKYELDADITDKRVSETLRDIAEEEKVHVGELLALLDHISPEDKKKVKEGTDEFKKASEIVDFLYKDASMHRNREDRRGRGNKQWIWPNRLA